MAQAAPGRPAAKVANAGGWTASKAALDKLINEARNHRGGKDAPKKRAELAAAIAAAEPWHGARAAQARGHDVKSRN
jgi:hypothetical protein